MPLTSWGWVDDSEAVGDRIPFSCLLGALSPLCCEPRDCMTVLPFTRLAIVSAPGAATHHLASRASALARSEQRAPVPDL